MTPTLSAAALLGPFPRAARAWIDEAELIFRLLSASPVEHLMVDVGAHHGDSLRRFAAAGWQVFAFEPDARNRTALLERVRREKLESVRVDPRALAEHPVPAATFYASAESTGVSSLSPFLPSHEKASTVEVSTLSTVIGEFGIRDIGFLKIDTEGHDLFVLRGFPWSSHRPGAILCEFEDRKTVPLGYRHQDLAELLESHRYQVFVSEWHPVLRYGVRHQWLRLARWSDRGVSPEAWGNLLAFADSSLANDLPKIARSYLVKGGLVGRALSKLRMILARLSAKSSAPSR